jgi:hypothetical protein
MAQIFQLQFAIDSAQNNFVNILPNMQPGSIHELAFWYHIFTVMEGGEEGNDADVGIFLLSTVLY